VSDTSTRFGYRLARLWRELSRLTRLIVVSVLVVALVALGFFAWDRLNRCGPGVAKVDGQCIGITDGTAGAVFGAGTAAALRLIGEENARLAADRSGIPVVAVAYVIPIPPPGVDDDYAARLNGDLMGVAVAQRQANRTNTAGDRPLVRVLVANIGESGQPAKEPITSLVEMATTAFAEQHLMAVAISGKSLAPITEAIDTLLGAGVPLIVAHLTADQLTTAPVTPDSALARVAPTTSDEAAAAAAYLRASTKRALIVQNTDPEDGYAQDLGRAFRERYAGDGHEIVEPSETYNGRREGAANAMRGIVRNICQQRPDAVFFAGRSPELAALVAALPSRPCLDVPVRVMTGDDGASLTAAVAGDAPELRRGLRANASVVYTALAHPDAWRAAPTAFQAGSADYLTGHCPECFPTLFPGYRLDDGYAIMAYDAIMTAVAGIRSPNGPVGSPGALIQEFKRLHGAGSVAGASGWISLTPTGNTINKAVPILGIGPDGAAQFRTLSSPSGTPCTPGTTLC
jgi:ABC-type branched-subunit amino acid transport system substrate-binding protein